MIRMQKLNKYFNRGKQNEIHVINNIDLELPDRGMVAIYGPSGCGKTTLLNVIGGLDRFDGGSLTLDGESILKNTDELRGRLIGYIFQNYNLNREESCFDNVADALRLCGMTDKNEIEARVMAALANVDMERYRARTPDTLSGGQQQRIAIARAIVKNPRIILADEPTGNLDEANTVMIMDLLRAIANEHLVLLVTHEANLVDYYCDRVIELRDGQVVSVRENAAGGYAARDKNDIFLGELESSRLIGENAEIEYFGDAPAEPVRLRIVNNAGKLYLQIQTPKVHLLDESSEIRLREGVFEEQKRAAEQNAQFDMSRLPPVEGRHYGKLFGFVSSLKSGFRANFSKRKKGKKLLLSCMVLFSAVLVLLSAIFGTAFDKLITVNGSYNHNVFYVYTPDGSVSEVLTSALTDPSSGVDSLHLYESFAPTGDSTVNFISGYFESFNSMGRISANAVVLEQALVRDARVLAGSREGLGKTDLIISSALADALIESSTLGYLKTYDRLIGLITNDYAVDGQNLRIACVVDAEERALYPSDLALAQLSLQNRGLYLSTAEAYGTAVNKGEAILIYNPAYTDSKQLPAVGSSVSIHGLSLTLSARRQIVLDYTEWCNANDCLPDDIYTWAQKEIKRTQPSLDPKSEEFGRAVDELQKSRYYAYQIETYYAHMDAFLREVSLYSNDSFEAWLYAEKGVDEAKYYFMDEGEMLYYAARQKQATGTYPTRMDKHPEGADSALKQQLSSYFVYEDEFYHRQGKTAFCYLVNESDYIQISKQLGDTHATATNSSGEYIGGYYPKETVAVYPSDVVYTTLHSSDPAQTEAWLAQRLPELRESPFGLPAIVSPSYVRENRIGQQLVTIISQLISMVALLAVLSICMYFIMRASLLNRIKEIGIYRAIGVSRRNLVQRFLVEALVLTSLTVLVGFVASSLLLGFWLSLSPMMSSLFFYPPWLALILLALLYAICLFCGTVPILALLRKTPSQILAKYDI